MLAANFPRIIIIIVIGDAGVSILPRVLVQIGPPRKILLYDHQLNANKMTQNR